MKVYQALPPVSSRDEITAIVQANALAQPLPFDRLDRLVVAIDKVAAEVAAIADKVPAAPQ